MDMVKRVRNGDVRVASRLIRGLEDQRPEARQVVENLFAYTGRAHIVGITGPPGAGKSTLTDALISVLRANDRTVGVLAVDPTSPFTGGAILGDRIRMQRHAEDPGVFVRSLATRGALGGLSNAVGDAVHVLDAMGKDVIIVETVGTGQQEVDIINHAHTVVVVMVPGMGDAMQAIKAGIMEIGDVFIVNKADRDGARQLKRELQVMIEMADVKPPAWKPSIVWVESMIKPITFRMQIEEAARRIEEHHEHLVSSGDMALRIRRQMMIEFKEALRFRILDPILEGLEANGELDRIMSVLMRKESDAHSLAGQIAHGYFKEDDGVLKCSKAH
jgi:LAO/AO transport system kinase